MLLEYVCKFEKLSCISGQSRELGEDETCDMAFLYICKHPFCFRMMHYAFTAHRF